MKKFFLSGLGIAAILCAGMLTVSLAAGAEPGSNADPLVSKSYVDEQISAVLSVLNDGAAGGSGTTTAGGSYTPVSVAQGQTLLGGEGTEIILRSGQAVGHCPGDNGIVNATTGQEVYQNTNIEVNHLLIVPRDDGRGVTAATDIWLLVKGGYELLN